MGTQPQPRAPEPNASAGPGTSIQLVHDDVKDKPYELELSWISPEVGVGAHNLAGRLVRPPHACASLAVARGSRPLQSGNQHALVPQDLITEADAAARAVLEAAEMED